MLSLERVMQRIYQLLSSQLSIAAAGWITQIQVCLSTVDKQYVIYSKKNEEKKQYFIVNFTNTE